MAEMENEQAAMSCEEALSEIMSDIKVTIKSYPVGSPEWKALNDTYMAYQKTLNETEKAVSEINLNYERSRLDEEKVKIETEKANSEKKKGIWGNVISAAGTALAAGLGFLTLKYNMDQGNLVGKDSKPWISELLKKK